MNQAMMLKCKPALLVSDEVHHELRLRGLSSHLLVSFSENSGTTVLLVLELCFSKFILHNNWRRTCTSKSRFHTEAQSL